MKVHISCTDYDPGVWSAPRCLCARVATSSGDKRRRLSACYPHKSTRKHRSLQQPLAALPMFRRPRPARTSPFVQYGLRQRRPTHTHTRTHTYTNTHTAHIHYIYTHTHARIHMHAYTTHAHQHTRMHAHTHTHARDTQTRTGSALNRQSEVIRASCSMAVHVCCTDYDL